MVAGLTPEEDDAVEEAADDVELPLEEPASDSTAEKRSCINFLIACRGSWVESAEPAGFVGVADPVEEAEESRLAATSLRKVVKSGLAPDVLLVLFDEPLAESAETRLLKSDCSLLMAPFVEEVEVVDAELLEPACNCEISCSSPFEKLEFGDAAVEVVAAVPAPEEDVAVEEAEDDEPPFEPDSDSTAENRTWINFPISCRGFSVESAEPVGFVDVVEAEVSRLAATSWRKVVRFGLPADVLVVLFDVPLPESAETKLLKSDCSLLMAPFVEEVAAVDELFEPASNCEIS